MPRFFTNTDNTNEGGGTMRWVFPKIYLQMILRTRANKYFWTGTFPKTWISPDYAKPEWVQ